MTSFGQLWLFLLKNSLPLYWIAVLHFALRRPVANKENIKTMFSSSLHMRAGERWPRWKVSPVSEHWDGDTTPFPFLSRLFPRASEHPVKTESGGRQGVCTDGMAGSSWLPNHCYEIKWILSISGPVHFSLHSHLQTNSNLQNIVCVVATLGS